MISNVSVKKCADQSNSWPVLNFKILHGWCSQTVQQLFTIVGYILIITVIDKYYFSNSVNFNWYIEKIIC